MDLPKDPNDDAGKSRLRIWKRFSSSANGSGLPETYSGLAQIIDPADNDIACKAQTNRWEVNSYVADIYGGYWITTQTDITAIMQEAVMTKNSIAVYPNPAGSFIHIEAPESLINTRDLIVDVNGKIVQSPAIKGIQNTLGIESLFAGTYLVKFENGSSMKFIKN